MGEVYQALDTRLDREVAVKVLPQAFTGDAERMARFEREAKILASLNHANIAGIHQVEVVDETTFLVMELVPGEDLAEVLGRGSVAAQEAIQVAVQIAEALEVAHERGIVHRDLKPANIKIAPDGQVKILDFGLAKARGASDGGSSADSLSPTLTADMTQAGVIVGTAAYMSPEQARGQEADSRSDIWSLGVVLFEMLTGERLFAGPTVSDTLAAVLRADPDWEKLPPETPRGVRRVLRRCLVRQPKQRLHSAADVRIELEEAGNPVHEPPPAATGARPGLLAAVGAVALVVGFIVGAALWPRGATDSSSVRSFIPPPPGNGFELHPYLAGSVAVSPDGTSLVYSVRPATGPAKLWIRRLDETDARPLDGTEGASHPFWSPDSRFVAFFADGAIRKVEAAGGPVVSITETGRGLSLRYNGSGEGGTWGRNGDILYALGWNSPLYRVSSSGGKPEPLSDTQLRGEGVFLAGALHPRFFPDGDRFLFVVGGPDRQHKLMISSLSGEAPRELMQTLSHAELAAGHLWFVRKGTLFAQPIDLDTAILRNEPIPIAQGMISNVWSEAAAQGYFSTSPAGVVAYQTGAALSKSILTWFSRTGEALEEVGTADFQYQLSLAPDGSLAMVQVGDMKTAHWGLWTHDLGRGTRSRFNARRGVATAVWSPDSREVFFQGGGEIHRQTVGVDDAVLAWEGDAAYGRDEIEIAWPLDWSADGGYLVYASVDQGNLNADLWVRPLEDGGAPIPIQQSPASEEDAAISPDGRWLAYTSDKSGQFEIYLTEFPTSRRSLQVSADGGLRPEWGQSTTELFFLAPDDTLMVATLATDGEEISVREVKGLFALDVRHHVLFEPGGYAVASDSGRFLVNRVLEKGTTSPIALIVGWPEELSRSN